MVPGEWLDRIPIPTTPNGNLDITSESLLAAVEQHKADLQVRARAISTSAAYASDWIHFLTWCDFAGLRVEDLTSTRATEGALLIYLAYHLYNPDPSIRLAPRTMDRRLSGIKASMRDLGLPFPAHSSSSPLAASIAVAKRELEQKDGRATAISERLLIQMINACDLDRPKGLRDKALLLLGFCGAFRRSELVGLDLEDLTFEEDGLVVRLRRSKTDQQGKGRDVYIPFGKHSDTCPVRAVQRWLEVRGTHEGPLFYSMSKGDRMRAGRIPGVVVNQVVQKYSEAVGASGSYSAHSLRSGLATSAARAGANLLWIKRQTGHRSTQSVEGYIQAGTGFRDNVMQFLDL